MDDPVSPLELLADATRDLVRSVDGLSAAQLQEPSLLPGWRRAHVVAHLALNAEGLAGALTGVAHRTTVHVYESQAARDRDIEELAAAPEPDLRARFLASTTAFADAAELLSPDDWEQGRVVRHPDGPRWPAHVTPTKRLTEVALHHVDLDVDHDLGDWPPALAVTVLEGVAPLLGRLAPVRIEAVDVDRSWIEGEGGPLVRGRAAELVWWLSGRGDRGLSAEPGPVPVAPSW